MKRFICRAALASALCAVLPGATTGSGGEKVRSYTYQDHAIMVIDLTNGYVEFSAVGVGSHLGRVRNESTGYIDLQTMEFIGAVGALTTPNGDQVFWEGSGTLGGEMLIVITGGTGRFESITGEIPAWTYSNVEQVIEGNHLILTLDEKGSGWISY